jgi:hypothetical protein
VVDTDGTIIHTEQVPEIANEPNYDAALAVLFIKSNGISKTIPSLQED